jgi:simple sugar transport system ATP-binding protein
MPRDTNATKPRAFGLETVGLTKRFGDLLALDRVDLRVRAGSVHALLGENGAGKSTLVKCVMGYHRADSGDLLVDDRQQIIPDPRAAQKLGLGMVYQHFTLVPHMTVLENVVMARADVPAVIDWRRAREDLQAFLAELPFDIPIDEPTSGLAAGEKQKAEIVKQLYLGTRFLVLDEPTSVLTPNEADEVLGLVRRMAHAGELTVLIITHKFREVTAFADAVSIMRRGSLVGGGRVDSLSTDEMARLMIADTEVRQPAARAAHTPGAVGLAVDRLTVNDDEGAPAVRDLSLSVRAGEIVGVAGVSGNGQSELVQVLAGQRAAVAGQIRVDDAPYHARRAQMRRHGVAILPEEPLRNACVPRMSVADNMALRRFDQPPYTLGGWWLNRRAIRRGARQMIEAYRVKASSPDAPIGQLSGGNVQRAVLARELSDAADLLIAANPVFGLDFSAVAEIRAQIVEARNRGAAVLLVSEDLDELFELADRLTVMFEGKLVHETAPDETDTTAIGRLMAGH